MKNDYIVTLTSTTTRILSVADCNSLEEAEAIAESLYNDDPDIGELVESELEVVEAHIDEGANGSNY